VNCIAFRLFACAAAFVLISPEFAAAQRRGGGPPGAPGGPGRGGRGGTGTVERITVHGTALEGNAQGESADREVTVYLPPSYAADQARRFPVVYLLHGAAERETAFTEVLARLPQSADRLAGAQGFSEFIVVTPNASTRQKESMYAASPASGNWERFIADDLVSAIDARYRTLAHRMSRGLAGHDAGAAAALRIGMKRPEVFADLYLMSAALDAAGMPELEKNAANLNAYYSIAIDVGDADPLLERNRQLHAAMTKLRIPHTFEEYSGDRSNRIRERIEWNVLPFFARNLAAPANLTSPSPSADRLATPGR
jgi:enterochelin esterase-like enzyme